MTSLYTPGQSAVLTVTWRDDQGALIDPVTISLALTLPDSSVVAYVYDTDPEVVRVSQGVYRVVRTVDQPGTWRWRWEATGVLADAQEGAFFAGPPWTRAEWPTSYEVLSFLAAAGFTVSAEAGTDQVLAAVDEWERLTGWQPFLGPTDDGDPVLAVRAFDPPEWGDTLPLRGGLLSIEGVTVGVSPTSTGTVLAATGYQGEPVLGQPFTELRFRTGWHGGPGSVRIEGWWGYCSTLPHDAYDAVLKRAASLLLAQVMPALDSMPVSQGSLKLGGGSMLGGWNTAFENAAARYRRVDL